MNKFTFNKIKYSLLNGKINLHNVLLLCFKNNIYVSELTFDLLSKWNNNYTTYTTGCLSYIINNKIKYPEYVVESIINKNIGIDNYNDLTNFCKKYPINIIKMLIDIIPEILDDIIYVIDELIYPNEVLDYMVSRLDIDDINKLTKSVFYKSPYNEYMVNLLVNKATNFDRCLYYILHNGTIFIPPCFIDMYMDADKFYSIHEKVLSEEFLSIIIEKDDDIDGCIGLLNTGRINHTLSYEFINRISEKEFSILYTGTYERITKLLNHYMYYLYMTLEILNILSKHRPEILDYISDNKDNILDIYTNDDIIAIFEFINSVKYT